MSGLTRQQASAWSGRAFILTSGIFKAAKSKTDMTNSPKAKRRPRFLNHKPMQAGEFPMSPPSPEKPTLDEFKQFIYGSYAQTHNVLADALEGEATQRMRQFETLLRKALPDDKQAPILDFGCGDGVLLSAAQKLGYRNLTGVDFSARLIERASLQTSAKLHQGNGLDLLKACRDGTFEAITAFDVFEHLTRPELLETCREVARALRPGGRLLVRVPNGASPFCGAILAGDLTHERAYTKSSLTQILLPLGFTDIQVTEVAPFRHGIKSTIRSILWWFFRAWAVLWMAVETGDFRGHVLTLNLFLKARKAAP